MRRKGRCFCIACRRGAARKSRMKSSMDITARCWCRQRTGCTCRRVCWPGSYMRWNEEGFRVRGSGFRVQNMRKPSELRPVKIRRGYTKMSPGSVMIEAGNTRVLCTASVEPKVPDWLKGKAKGWITAEYNMLPHSTSPRKARERGLKMDGRTTEIQRLIGRSLRSVANLAALGERSILVDCDVIEADGGTRTASITGGFIALVDCLRSIQK